MKYCTSAIAASRVVTDIVAGAASQLVARGVVRKELRSESSAPKRTAAGVPSTMTARKMKASPSVTLAPLLGMRMGSELARTTKLASARNCKPSTRVNDRQQKSAHAPTVAPAPSAAHQ